MVKKERDPNSKRKLNYQGPLPPETEKALVQVLLDKRLSGVRFKNICDTHPDLFGEPGSQLRLRVQKRRNYLRTSSEGLVSAVNPFSPVKAERDSNENLLASQPAQARIPDHFASPPAASRSTFPALLTPSPIAIARTRTTIMAPQGTTSSGNDPTTTFTLHIDHPWKNPFGMLVVKGTEVEESNTVIDKLTILKPIFDYSDFDKKMFKGRLCHDGGGMIITEPTLPGYIWQDPKSIQMLIDEADSIAAVCQPSYRTFKTIRTDMKKDRTTRTRDIVYRFPTGMTCNNEFFNSQNRRSSQLDLDCDMHIHKIEIGEDEELNTLYQFCPFIVWRVAIDGLGKQTTDDGDGGLGAATKAFAKLGIKKRGTAMDEDS